MVFGYGSQQEYRTGTPKKGHRLACHKEGGRVDELGTLLMWCCAQPCIWQGKATESIALHWCDAAHVPVLDSALRAMECCCVYNHTCICHSRLSLKIISFTAAANGVPNAAAAAAAQVCLRSCCGSYAAAPMHGSCRTRACTSGTETAAGAPAAGTGAVHIVLTAGFCIMSLCLRSSKAPVQHRLAHVSKLSVLMH